MKLNARSAIRSSQTRASDTPVITSSSVMIVMRSVASLVFYVRNPRKNDHVVDRMMESIREFGFKIPVLARSDGEVVDGHLRLKAAKKLGITEVPVILCDEWTQAQVKAFRLLVNRSATWADWNMELLEAEVADLNALGFDLELTGFDDLELDALLRDPMEEEKAEQAPPLPEVAVSRIGDLWLLGKHRLQCGDATRPEDVTHVLGQLKPFLMVTDAPYGVSYSPSWREDAGLGHQRQTGEVANDDRVDWSAAYKLFPGDVIYAWHAGIYAAQVAAGLTSIGFEIRTQIIWSKQHFAMSRGHYHWGHEPCWHAVRKGRKANWCGDRTQSTVWQVPNLNPIGGDRNEKATGHGTQKPIELMRRPIVNHTKRGDAVYDPFLGSGTTMMAAELTERACCGIDIDPRYVDVAVIRWQQFTGKKAVLDGSRLSFEAIAAERVHVAV